MYLLLEYGRAILSKGTMIVLHYYFHVSIFIIQSSVTVVSISGLFYTVHLISVTSNAIQTVEMRFIISLSIVLIAFDTTEIRHMKKA